MKLSIIVPVYNVCSYLERCVKSLLDQDLVSESYEIILVDDGSTDGGGDLCDEFAHQERRIHVIHQSNQGLSVTRNIGLKNASGEYILFVDSDDWIEPNVLNSLVQRMEIDDLDILRFCYRRIGDSVSADRCVYEESVDNKVWTGPEFLMNKLWYSCYAWQFLIKKELLLDNALFFKPGIIFEDAEWTPRVLGVAQRVSESSILVYNYFIRLGSITNSAIKKRIAGQLSIITELKTQMRSLHCPYWHEGMIAHIVVSIISSVAVSLYSDRDYYLKELSKKQIYPLSSFLARKIGRIKIRIINFSPRLACFLIHHLNRYDS